MYRIYLVSFLCLSSICALPSPYNLVDRDQTTNASISGDSSNITLPTSGGTVITPDPNKVFGDNQALLQEQEAKEKAIEDGDQLDSVSGGWWGDIEKR